MYSTERMWYVILKVEGQDHLVEHDGVICRDNEKDALEVAGQLEELMGFFAPIDSSRVHESCLDEIVPLIPPSADDPDCYAVKGLPLGFGLVEINLPS